MRHITINYQSISKTTNDSTFYWQNTRKESSIVPKQLKVYTFDYKDLFER